MLTTASIWPGARTPRRAYGYAWRLAAIALLIGLAPQAAAGALPAEQAAPHVVTLPVVVPQQPTDVALHTHLVRIELTPDVQGAILDLTAEYRLRNDNRTDASVPVQWEAQNPAGVTVTIDDAPLAATATGQVATAQVDVPADGERTLILQYQQVLPAAAIQSLRYPTRSLDPWGGQPSLRVDLAPGSALPPEAWITTTPPSWRYAPPAVTDDTALEWLYDGGLPDAILFEFVAPPTWQEIQQLAAAANTPVTYGALGDAYRRVAAAAAVQGRTAVQERYYAQAVAAYTAGIRAGADAGAGNTEIAGLHASLAALYRSQVVGADGVANPVFAELMTLEADKALPGIMADDLRRAELERWQAEGLRLLLADARRRGDIATALALIDRLSTTLVDATSATFLAAERQALLVQQALVLLEQGDRAAALALAGDVLTDPTLLPPDELRARFTRWSIDAAIGDGGIDLTITGDAAPERVEAVRTELRAIVERWQRDAATASFSFGLEEPAGDVAATPRFTVRVGMPAGATGAVLAAALPAGVDWALLQSVLAQLGPKLESESAGLRQRIHVTQPVDLRGAGEQWRAMAQSLADQAAQLADQAASGAGEAATLESSLRARVEAANYRHAAEQWQDLARNSQVVLSLRTGGPTGAARSWMLTVASPAQLLDVQVEALAFGRAMALVAGVLAAIVLVAAALWRLL